jgi:hypothetical protein
MDCALGRVAVLLYGVAKRGLATPRGANDKLRKLHRLRARIVAAADTPAVTSAFRRLLRAATLLLIFRPWFASDGACNSGHGKVATVVQ